MPIQSNNIFKANDELDDLWGTNTGLAISNVEYEENKNQIKIITNYFPDYPLFENSIWRGGPYASNPRAMPLDEVNIFLYPSSFDYTSHQPNNIYIYNPQLFDIGIIGRPNELLEEAQHWTEETSPQEAISLDPLSIEAWDANLAGNSYEGILRLNVVAIDKFKNDIEYSQFKNYNGRPLRLFNDVYGGHTQPHGEYHLHSFKDTKDLKYKNKVIGYSFDSNNFGFPIMGLGTEIYEPIFDANNYLINFETQKLPSISGYTLSNSFIDNRKSQVPLVGSIDNIPETAPGIFHVDYEYIGSDGAQKSNESYYLDIFNMGFVDIGNDIVKAYVQTEEYPYTVHTPLSFDLKESETDLQSTHNFFEYNNRNQLKSSTYNNSFSDYNFFNRGNDRYEIQVKCGCNKADDLTDIATLTFTQGTSNIDDDITLNIVDDIKGAFDQVTGKEDHTGQMFRLYNAAFARFPDADGLEYWIDKNGSGENSKREVAQSFLASDEFSDKYGDNVSTEDYVKTLYNNILGRTPDPEGYNYWVGQLSSGAETRAEALLGFAESAENKALFSDMTGVF